MPEKIQHKKLLKNKYGDSIFSDFQEGYWYISLDGEVLTRDEQSHNAWRNAYQILELGFEGQRYEYWKV